MYVKEHPTQVSREWRETSFYKEILSLPNVKLIHPSVNPIDIIKKFNRYPYRNKVLCRKSTKEEIEYLNATHHKFFNI